MLYAKFGWNWSSVFGEDENTKDLRQSQLQLSQRNLTKFNQESSFEPSAQLDSVNLNMVIEQLYSMFLVENPSKKKLHFVPK